jgi:type II secretory pathway predicted ATPase ExeA
LSTEPGIRASICSPISGSFTRTRFSKTIPAAQLCDRASHQEAVARIRFRISESLLGVITGEVGVGKTVAVRTATSQLDATAHHIIYIATSIFRARTPTLRRWHHR